MTVYRLTLREDLLLLGHRMRHLSRILTSDHPELTTAIAAFSRAKILYENSRSEPKLRKLVCHCEAFDRYQEKVLAGRRAWAAREAGKGMLEPNETEKDEKPDVEVEVAEIVEETRMVDGTEVKIEIREPRARSTSSPIRIDEGCAFTEDTGDKDSDSPDTSFISFSHSEITLKSFDSESLVGLGVTCCELDSPSSTPSIASDSDSEDEYESANSSPDDKGYSSDDSWDSAETSCTDDDCGCDCDGEQGSHQPFCKVEEGARVRMRSSPKFEPAFAGDGAYCGDEDVESEDDYESDFEEMTAEMQRLIIATPWRTESGGRG